MATYSNSKISTFEQCKYKYKLRYIDRVKVEVPTTIEAFMGSMVHETLEHLYRDIQNNKTDSKEDLFNYYSKIWDKNYTDNILIVRKEYSPENYKEKGAIFISDYYDRHKPFSQLKIIGIETQKKLALSNGDSYHIRIDRLESDKNGNYYICDYKTSSSMKTREEANNDMQLPMYALWVKKSFSDVKSLNLIWHMLAFDKDIILKVDEKKLEMVRKQIEEKIRKIESCKEFPTQLSSLCNWCVYRSICPAFKHEVELETKKGYEGLELADKYVDLNSRKKRIEEEIDEVKKELVEFSKENEIEVVYGSEKKVSVKPHTKIEFKDKEKMINIMKKKGIYDNFSSINYLKLASEIIKGKVDEDVIKLTEKKREYRLSISKNNNSGKEGHKKDNHETERNKSGTDPEPADPKLTQSDSTTEFKLKRTQRVRHKSAKGLMKYF